MSDRPIPFEALLSDPDAHTDVPAPGALHRVLPQMPRPRPERPGVVACFAQSLDGKLGHPDAPAGPEVAARQGDPVGAEADVWTLAMARALVDATIMGAGTLVHEPDAEPTPPHDGWRDWRRTNRRDTGPIAVVVTRRGGRLPTDHQVLQDPRTRLATSPAGGGFLGPQLPDGGARLLVTGEGGSPSLPSLMQRLRDDGVRHALVESPSLTAQLAALGMVDELWLTTSGLLLGGDRTIGAARALPLDRVPRGRLVGLHRVGDGFLFARWVLSSQS